MVEIKFRPTYDGKEVRVWQEGWASDTFETMTQDNFEKFRVLNKPFSIKFTLVEDDD